MSSKALPAPATQLFRYIFEQASLGIAVEDLEGNLLLANPALCSMLGYTEAELCGMSCSEFANPEDSQDDWAQFQRLRAGVIDHYSLEKRYVRKNGTQIWGRLNVSLSNDDGGSPLVFAFVEEITERKRTEDALRESEEKYRRVVDHLHDALMIDDAAGQVIFANDRFLQLFGIDQAELKNINIEDYVAPEFRAQLRDRHERRIRGESAGEQFEYEGIRRDGERIWLEVNVVPIRDATGKTTHTQSVIRDITERKQADAALTRVSRKLIQAQEQERTRIARELHDDIGQRLAMLTIEIEELQQGSFDLPAHVRSRVDRLKKQTSDISIDIQSLSHELHSAKLEYLGITAAMKGFCKEFAEQQKVDIEFRTNDLPSLVPPDVSLCFLRVLQEALHNSAKHSGVRRFEVQLWGTSDAIHLAVRDSGSGFNLGTARMGRGLGLISMEERLKVLKGTLSIETEARRGTTIHARVPLSATSDSVRAAS
jgi:PAS domain S-box-containing protein